MPTEEGFNKSGWSDIGPRLKVWRKKKELTLHKLSSIIMVSQGSLSDLENSNGLPSFETLARYRFFFPDDRWLKIFFG